MNSLFVEQHPEGVAFYINGDLQFDSADEGIYHEHLVIPAIALAQQRFPQTPLRVLICGGGDGLAARDVLRFDDVRTVDLVDYDAEVIHLGQTTFAPYNQYSLCLDQSLDWGEGRVNLQVADALEFVERMPAACYHAVILDFTSPTRAEHSRLYSQEFYQQIRRILYPGGSVAVNAVSPEQSPSAFWCIYQTLFAAGLQPKPLRLEIPSFRAHDYGEWGFFFASTQAPTRAELVALSLPDGLRYLRPQRWLRGFEFEGAIATLRHAAPINTLANAHLFYCVLNPFQSEETPDLRGTGSAATSPEPVNFLEFQDTAQGVWIDRDPLSLEAIAQQWLPLLSQLRADVELPIIPATQQPIAQPTMPEIRPLPTDRFPAHPLPIQHAYHDERMVQAEAGHLQHLLTHLDLPQFLAAVADRAQTLPPKLAQEIQGLRQRVTAPTTLLRFSDSTVDLVGVLALTLLMANLVAPDLVFGKSSFSGSSGGGSYSGGSYSDGSYSGDGGTFGWLGFSLFCSGIGWLIYLSATSEGGDSW